MIPQCYGGNALSRNWHNPYFHLREADHRTNKPNKLEHNMPKPLPLNVLQ